MHGSGENELTVDASSVSDPGVAQLTCWAAGLAGQALERSQRGAALHTPSHSMDETDPA